MAENKFLHLNAFLLLLNGMYPGNTNNTLKQYLIYFWEILCLFGVCATALACTMDLVLREKTEFIGLALIVVNICNHSATILTMLYFQLRGHRTRQLIQHMNDVFQSNSENGIRKCSMKYTVKFVNLATVGWHCFCFIVAHSLTISPIISGTFYDKVLPIPTWYPFNTKQSPTYELTYLFQIFSQSVMAIAFAASDIFIFSALTLTSAQFRILGCNFENFVYTGLLKHGMPEENVIRFSKNYNGENTDDGGMSTISTNDTLLSMSKPFKGDEIRMITVIKSAAGNAEILKIIVNCIHHHQALLSFCNEVKSYFNPLLLLKLTFNVFFLVFFTFGIVASDDMTVKVALFQYLMSSIGQSFFWTYCGYTLMTESENIKNDIYKTPWFVCSQQCKTLLLVILMRCRRPVVLSVGYVVDMTLDTYIKILRMSFSYYTILRQVVQR